jgi:hypothetical protein
MEFIFEDLKKHPVWRREARSDNPVIGTAVSIWGDFRIADIQK